MAKAVEAVVDSYRGQAKNARAAVYIGDGRSAAHLIEPDEFQKLSGRLADARIPLSSYAVGSRLDPQLLGALAVQSGGTVIVRKQYAGQGSGTFVGGRGRRDGAVADFGHVARRDDRGLSQADAAVARRSRDDRARNPQGKRAVEDST